jgi:hypothetical protein
MAAPPFFHLAYSPRAFVIRVRNYLSEGPVLFIGKGNMKLLRNPMITTQVVTNQLATLFHGSETWLGVFYPRKYIIATLPSFETALQGHQALRAAGLGQEDMCAASGVDMLRFFAGIRARTGLLGSLMLQLSRVMGTEATFFDHDVWEAQHGAAFLAVHCSTERAADSIRLRLIPLHPMAMQWYRAGGVQTLV